MSKEGLTLFNFGFELLVEEFYIYERRTSEKKYKLI
jgi:hypothetical protein